MISIGIAEGILECYSPIFKRVENAVESILEIQEIKNSPNGKQFDILVSYAKGFGEDAAHISFDNTLAHLWLLENKYTEQDYNKVIKDADPIDRREPRTNLRKRYGKYTGLIFPEHLELNLQWWIYQISCLSMIINPPEDSLLFLAKGEENFWGLDPGDFYANLTRKSRLLYESEKGKGIPIVVPSHINPSLSEPHKRFLNEVKLFAKYIDDLKKIFPPVLSSYDKLNRLFQQLGEKTYANCNFLVTGPFSSGKTTLINQVILPENLMRLPTDAAANTAVPLEIFVDPNIESKTPEIVIYPKKRCTHTLVSLITKNDDISIVPFEYEKDYKKHQRNINEHGFHVYYLKFGNIGDVCKKILNFRKSRWGSTCSVNLYIEYENKDLLSKGFKTIRQKTGQGRKAFDISKLQEYLTSLDSKEVREPYFKSYRELENGSFIKKIELEISWNSNKNGIFLKAGNQKELDSYFQDSDLSWLTPHARCKLPAITEVEWMNSAIIYDTPGIGSGNKEHDSLTNQQIDRCGPGDVIMIVISIRGGRKGLEGSGIDFFEQVEKRKKEQKIILVVNCWSKTHFSPENEADGIKSDIIKLLREKHIESRIKKEDIYVADFMNTENSACEKFEKQISQLTAHFTKRSVKNLAELVLNSIGEGLSEENTDLALITIIKKDLEELESYKRDNELIEKLEKLKKSTIKLTLQKSFEKHEKRRLLFLKRHLTERLILKEVKDNRGDIAKIFISKFIDIEMSNINIPFFELQENERLESISRHLHKHFSKEHDINLVDDWQQYIGDGKLNPYPKANRRFVILSINSSDEIGKKIGEKLNELTNKMEKRGSRFINSIKNIFNKGPYGKWEIFRENQIESLEEKLSIVSEFAEDWANGITECVFEKLRAMKNYQAERGNTDFKNIAISTIKKRFRTFVERLQETERAT